MIGHDSVTASVEVHADPDEAFRVFTAEIDSWYRVDRFTVVDYTRTKAIVFEPWVGGRLLDVHDEESGTGQTMAHITVWQPGGRLCFVDERDTEVDVSFTATTNGTRITLEHRGLSKLAPADPAREYGWRVLLPWYRHRISSTTGRKQT